MKRKFASFAGVLLAMTLMIGCSEEELLKSDYDYTPVSGNLPTISLTVGDITGATVVCSAVSTYPSDSSYSERGFICATDTAFKTGVVSQVADSGVFSTTVLGLTELTTYYLKAYVLTKDGISYSAYQTFATPYLSNPMAAICGTYIEADYLLEDGSLEATSTVSFEEIEGNISQINMVNFWGTSETIVVDVDLVANTVSIDPQVIFVSATYGNCYNYPYTSGALDNTGTPLIGTINPTTHVITLNSWAATVSAGTFGLYASTTLTPLASTLVGTYTETDYLLDKSVEATYTDKITISMIEGSLKQVSIDDFWDGGEVITADINADGSLSIAPQVIDRKSVV